MNLIQSRPIILFVSIAASIVSVDAHVASADPDLKGAKRSELVVETSFPGGSGRVVSIDQDRRHISIEPTAHESRGWACWWYVRISGIEPGETIALQVAPEPWATPERAAFSIDNEHWRQTDKGNRSRRSMTYRQRVDAPIAWFAWGPPFTIADAQTLVADAADSCQQATAFTLCETRGGRPVPALRVQPAEQPSQSAIWIQARQHAWEAGSSWVCKGFVDWLVSDDTRAMQLRAETTLTIVPIMDVDNVAIGAGGKNQVPHDHNRDWSAMPHWYSVNAAMKELKRFDAANQLKVFVDLHNPGASTLRPFYYLPPSEIMTDTRQRNLDRFLAASRIEMTGPLQFVGETRESGPSYDKQWKDISKNWVALNTNEHVVAATLETAWNTPNSTVDGYETVGRQLGLAVHRYMVLDSSSK